MLAITRVAALTPLGDGAGTWGAICAGRRVEERCSVAEELLEGERELDRSIRIGLAVARRALGNAKHETRNAKRETRNTKHETQNGVALFCGTSKGPVGVMLGAYEKVRRGETLGEMEAWQVAMGAGAMGAVLRERLGLAGEAVVHTSVAACASGVLALHRAVGALRSGECARALVVAADASRHGLFEGSFERLGVLAPPQPLRPEGLSPSALVRRCEPYGEEGAGFFVAEAGAAILLENIKHKTRNIKHGEKHETRNTIREAEEDVVAWVEDSWVGGDGTGIIAVDAEGRTLREGLRRCVGGGEVEFVQGHGTGTGHDAYEMAAIRETTGVPRERIFSHKKWLGHSLGAAGLVGVVISAMCHRARRLPEGGLVEAGGRSITVAQGFGGHVGMVVLRGN